MKNVYGKDINDNTRLTRHYQDWEVEQAKPNKDYITTDYFCPIRDVSYDDCLNKLGPLEDNEDELGIGLATLIKAGKDGIWYKSNGTFYFDHFDISLVNKCFRKYIDYFRDYMSFAFKDYGKTWALTKDELE